MTLNLDLNEQVFRLKLTRPTRFNVGFNQVHRRLKKTKFFRFIFLAPGTLKLFEELVQAKLFFKEFNTML